ncbi:MAG TPA: ThuA domain-containing protein [Planctomycetota bacterium]|nr:ThuA domain-containing protein [Planctomycetota bacterium]
MISHINRAGSALPFLALALLSFAAPAFAANDHIVFEGKDGPGKGKHLVFLAGDEEYRSEEALPMLAKILSQRHGFKCTVLFSVDADGTINPDNQKSLSNSSAIASADAIIMLLRFRNWPDADMKHFVDAYLAGKPIIALRTSTHAFTGIQGEYKAYNQFGKKVLGEQWVSHWGIHKKEATKGIIEPAAKDDPILRGVADIFGDTDVYEAYPPADAKILVRGQVLKGMKPEDPPADYKKKRATDKAEQGVNDPMMPVAWTREYKNEAGKTNKIFTTTMGSATDLQSEGLRRLVVNAVFWGLGMEVPSKADVQYVGEFKPTMYGFKSYKKGVKPADHAIDAKPAGEAKPGADATPAGAGAAPALATARAKLPPSAIPLEFIKGERIALVGSSLAERMNLFGHFETLLHSRFPQQELLVRNFARPADEVSIQQRSNDYTKIDDPFQVFGPDTIFCFFGYNESFAGPEGIEKFKTAYDNLLNDYAKKYPRDGAPPRYVIVSPIAFEATGDKFLPDGKKENANLKLYAEACAEVAKKRGLAFVDLFTQTEAYFAEQPGMQYTINGAHVNEAGDKAVATLLDRALFGTTNPAQLDSPKFVKLRAAVNDKSWVHLQDYRMLNGWYVYGGRRTWDKETFPLEYKKIRNMAAVRDRYVWDIAQDKQVADKPDDSKTGELHVPPTKFGVDKREAKEVKYLSQEEEIAGMKVPEGFEVQAVASEKEFPEIANVVQLNFDNKGRLWVSTMPSYPQWKPGDAKPSDKLLILEDLDEKGRARKCKVFYDKLVCPTGFEFWNGGVLVIDQPRMLFLKDTDGDDKADLVVQLTDGWASDDTHHTAGAFEWSPGGLLHMLEGVAMSTTLETPWGPQRNHGSSGAWVLDPRTWKVRHFTTPGYGNPWCYVFNWWGQGICGDGTGAQQHWDSPLSGAKFSGRRGMNAVFNNEGMRPAIGSEFLYSRHFPEDVQGQFIYACVINMNGMPRFQIVDDGSGFTGKRMKKMGKDDSGKDKEVPDDLLFSANRNFRPTDPQLGPDGALYFGDWANALIGHMQYSQRDPNRDHIHGRIYRMVAKGRPLLKPVTQFGKSVPELLEQLKEYETRTRYAARRELRDRPTAEVLAAVNDWVAKLDTSHKEYDRLLTEALWVQQGHHAVDVALLKKVLSAKTGEARAAATHVLADEWDRIPNAMELLKPLVSDEFARVRLEAVRALSFVPTLEAAQLALEVAKKPMDYWLEYTLECTIGALRQQWQPLYDKKQPVAPGNEAGSKFVADYMALQGPSGGAVKPLKVLLNGDSSPADRNKAINDLTKLKGNVDQGKQVFRRICVACHKVHGEGTEFGPDLTEVSNRLKRNELIESIVDPNAKVDEKWVTTNIITTDGRALTGIVMAEDAESVTLRVAGNADLKIAESKIKKTEIKKRNAVKSSSMPEGLAATMSAGEFLDLVEYLANRKSK